MINQAATKDNPFVSDYFPDLGNIVSVDFSQQYGKVNGISNTPVAGITHKRDATTGITKIGISPKSSIGRNEYGYARNVYADYVITYMHETIHQAGLNRPYTDRELATAAVNPRSVNGAPAYQLPPGALEEYNSLDPNLNGGNSRFYDKLLQYFCPGPSIVPRPTFGRNH